MDTERGHLLRKETPVRALHSPPTTHRGGYGSETRSQRGTHLHPATEHSGNVSWTSSCSGLQSPAGLSGHISCKPGRRDGGLETAA